jgi:hypothetical protein
VRSLRARRRTATRLPTGMLPLTSVITSVAYGSHEKLEIVFEGGAHRYRLPLEQLSDYVTERGNPGNWHRVRVAQISMPAEILRRGFQFVDSPGLGSASVDNSRTTQAFLPEADAVMLVSGFDGPLSEEEQALVSKSAAMERKLDSGYLDARS